jgi:CRISPR-associated Csx2 family protein
VRFVQEALIEFICKDWTKEDAIIVFRTKEANSKNWLDNGQDKTTDEIEKTGLKHLFIERSFIPIVYDGEDTIIADGFSEAEIWSIFNTVYEHLRENDEVYFDVTNAFRSIPMFSTILFNYAKLLKNIQLKAVYYGAFEKLGPAYEVKKRPLEERIAPILNLTQMSELQDWTIAARNFVKYGKTDVLHTELAKKYTPLLSENKDAQKLRCLDDSLSKVSSYIIANKLDAIVKWNAIKDNINAVKQSKSMIPAAFVPLLEEVEKKTDAFKQKDLSNVFAATDWCIKHELYQNAYSILLEGIISIILNDIGEEYSGQILLIEEKRNIITYVAKFKTKETKECCACKLSAHNKEQLRNVVEKVWDYMDDELSKQLDQLNQVRNAYMHAGTGTNSLGDFKTLKTNIQESYDALFNWYNKTHPSCE